MSGLIAPYWFSAAAPPATLSVAPGALAIYSVKQIAGYAGSFGIAQELSTNTTRTIGFAADGYYDHADLTTWAAGRDVRWNTIYDQSGSANHYVGSGSYPTHDPTASTRLGVPCWTIAPKTGTTQLNMPLPSGVTGSSQARTIISCDAIMAGLTTSTKWQLGTTSADRMMYQSKTESSLNIFDTATYKTTGVYGRTQMELAAISSSATNNLYRKDGVAAATLAASPLVTFTGGWVGKGDLSGYAYIGDYTFFAVWPSTLSAGVIAPMEVDMMTAFNVAGPTSRTVNICIDGDSLAFGQGTSYSLNIGRHLEPLLDVPAFIQNTGVPGRTLAQNYTNRVHNSTNRKKVGLYNIQVIEGGTNDISLSGTSATTLFTTLQNYLAVVNANYDKAIVGTLVPRNGNTGPMETERLAYNALVRDPTNQATYNYVCADYASLPAFDSSPSAASDYGNTTFYYTDGIHPNSNGYLTRATYLATVINPYI